MIYTRNGTECNVTQVMICDKHKGPAVSLCNKLYALCEVLVGSRNGFECDLHKKKLLVSQSN